MSDLKLDLSTNDLVFENGDLILTSEGSESTAQRLAIKLKMFEGEYFLNTEFGVPYYQNILTKGVSKAVVDGIYKDQILNTPGVVRINDYRSGFDRANRKYVAFFSVLSTSGLTETLEI